VSDPLVPETSQAVLARLMGLHPKKIDLSLGRIESLLEKLGHPEARLPPVIHVAGTNGKGSTVAYMRAVLEAAGKSVHVYTSPHLVRFHERVRLGAPGRGRLVSESQLVDALTRCERVNAGAQITFFEITTAAAYVLFSEHPADVLLLEVGLGGRVDTTNVVERPAVSVITPISMDHVDFLGDTLAKIAAEKAGIIKPGVPVVSAAQEDVVRQVLEAHAQRARSPIVFGGQDFGTRDEGGRLVFEDGDGLLDLPLPRLAGRHQIQNAGTAIAALRRFDPTLPIQAYERGMHDVDWPARLQRLTRGALLDLVPAGADLWLDGGHNPAGGRALAEAMADLEERRDKPLVLICGMLTTKDSAAFLGAFGGLAREMIAVPIGGDHSARTPEELAVAGTTAGIPSSTAPDFQDALRSLAARPYDAPPRILIAGSLYLAGEVLKANGTIPD
jgi:dihydrofolate synthase/folylpolyglutamate synthase